jgi:hypothetical protein
MCRGFGLVSTDATGVVAVTLGHETASEVTELSALASQLDILVGKVSHGMESDGNAGLVIVEKLGARDWP